MLLITIAVVFLNWYGCKKWCRCQWRN